MTKVGGSIISTRILHFWGDGLVFAQDHIALQSMGLGQDWREMIRKLVGQLLGDEMLVFQDALTCRICLWLSLEHVFRNWHPGETKISKQHCDDFGHGNGPSIERCPQAQPELQDPNSLRLDVDEVSWNHYYIWEKHPPCLTVWCSKFSKHPLQMISQEYSVYWHRGVHQSSQRRRLVLALVLVAVMARARSVTRHQMGCCEEGRWKWIHGSCLGRSGKSLAEHI